MSHNKFSPLLTIVLTGHRNQLLLQSRRLRACIWLLWHNWRGQVFMESGRQGCSICAPEEGGGWILGQAPKRWFILAVTCIKLLTLLQNEPRHFFLKIHYNTLPCNSLEFCVLEMVGTHQIRENNQFDPEWCAAPRRCAPKIFSPAYGQSPGP